MPQLSRRTFNDENRYETVVFQEDTHPADFELVEVQDIQNNEREALIQAILTDGAIGGGFKVTGGTGAGNSVFVAVGPAYVGGFRLILPDTLHQLVAGQYIYNMPIATPAVARTDLVYLDIFVDDVTSVQDPNIEDPTLGPSAYRERVRYNISISENVTSATPPTLPVGHLSMAMALITRRASDPSINVADVQDVRPIASFSSQFKPQHLIVVSPSGGDFTDPSLALASVTGLSSASAPYTILVRPGVYTITQPLVFNSPYVSMVGTDPDACVILGNFTGLSTARIQADHIVLKNLTLDYASGSGAHAAVVFFTGSFNAVLDNLSLGPAYYAGSVSNAFSGIDMTAGGLVKIRKCSVYAQNGSAVPAVAVGASCVVDMSDCQVLAASSDALTIANGATVTLRKCSFFGTRNLLISGANLTARDCVWQSQTLNTFTPAPSPEPVTLTQGVTCTMSDCTLDGGASSPKTIHVTDTSLIWNNVALSLQAYTSGGGSSFFRNVSFNGGLSVNGNAVNFLGCTFFGTYSNWAIGGVSNQALVIQGSTSPVVVDCLSDAGACVAILGGNPTFKGCRFTSSSASARVIDVLTSSAAVVVDGCLIQLFASYSLVGVVQIGGSAGSGSFTFTHNHVNGQAGGQPGYVLWAAASPNVPLLAGDNTSTASALRDTVSIPSYTNIAQV